ncbi:putative lanthionine synthetase c-like protein 1 [Phaeomoniella chlamydospora]|uniref:Putative lanthionine synthetase c-like protein 1 n=1 Tax=Phaeomoniella chlamydospora TaxID=158046 RepID=A0A0G2E2X3_PHACM|nr:putative lanthionine synthetase c-like protein 1 [Phaeomoniella chlamydospora]
MSYFENTGKPFKEVDARVELIAQLERILTHTPPSTDFASRSRGHGLYSGIRSTSFLFCRLSKLYPELKVRGLRLERIARSYLDAASPTAADSPDPSHCGIANELLLNLTLKVLLNEGKIAIDNARNLCSYAETILRTNHPDSSSNEWLYGRAGYLYFLRTVYQHLQSVDGATARTVYETMRRVAAGISAAPYPWTWHGKAYLGGAHGLVGIITQIVLSFPESASSMTKQLSGLLALQSTTSGNFPSSLPPHGDRLVQFCHGAPGFIASLSSLRPYFPDLQDRIDASLARARECVWERGLLTKNPCLCHGISGNAVVLGSEGRTRTFLSFTTREALQEIDYRGDDHGIDGYLGLYSGEAGRAWAWAVMDLELFDKFIGYNDI